MVRLRIQAAGKGAEAPDPVIHDDRTCHRDVDAESRRNFDDVIAAGEKPIGKHAEFRAKHIGRVKRMLETRQVDGAFDQFYADKLAAKRQHHLVRARPMIDRQVVGRLGGVRLRVESAAVGANREKELRAESMGRTQEVAQIHGLRYPFCSDGEVSAHVSGFSLNMSSSRLR